MQNLFSLGDLEDANNGKGSWALREYFLCIVTPCPTVVFDVAMAQRVITTDKKSPRVNCSTRRAVDLDVASGIQILRSSLDRPYYNSSHCGGIRATKTRAKNSQSSVQV
ncbi:unnamed protein product [Cylindrotheca closterium]|uniref:Uncharacterized protein n=1 Tax=Cylindrotheca closterium TaxID=2856 RepID=A0AAD2G879_9STRA|nr:unnamed protein product [Cylindrotheca closterium]